MELSELTTDESIAAQPHQIFLPGCFVVLQGIPGDGLSNTIETSPEFSQFEGGVDNDDNDGGDYNDNQGADAAVPDSEDANREAPSLEEDHFRRSLSAPSDENLATAQPQLSSLLATSNQHPTCALNNPVMNGSTVQAVAEVQSEASPPPTTPPEESFVVISGGDSPVAPPASEAQAQDETVSSNPQKQQAILQWNQDRGQQQRFQREEWNLQQRQHQPQSTASASSTTTTSAQQADWWLDAKTGHLAVFETLPPTGKKPTNQIGHLPPGTTITAYKLFTLDSESFQLIHMDEERGSADHKPPPPSPHLGVVQWLQIQWSTDATIATPDPNLIQPPTHMAYCVYSIHGYATLVPGIANLYMNPQVWWWRVTCKVGAFLRQGLELSSDHQCTIPYGSFVRVTRKTVNRMGLSRLRVEAQVDSQQRAGWCSEFLNPLSGQRGHVVQPLPMLSPAIYRVTLPEGAVIREDMELSSRQIGHVPCGTLVTIVQRKFSEHPQDQCVERLKLAGGKESGWISMRLNQVPPQDKCVVELVGVDPRFQPNQPGDFHWQVFEEERLRRQEEASPNASGGCGDLSSIDEDTSSDEKPKKTSSAQKSGRRKQQTETCLICLTEERNATIVHGETGHIACCLICARILKARGDRCPVCRLEIDSVIQHFWA